MPEDIDAGITGHYTQSDGEMQYVPTSTITEAVDPMSIPGFRKTTNFFPNYVGKKEKKDKKLISKWFSNLSRWGMNYEEDVINNMRAIPADKNLIPKPQQLLMQDLFANDNWKQKMNRDKSFYEKDFAQKRIVLRNLAVQPELEDILDTLTNEAIVYDSNYTYFLEPYIDENETKDLDPKVNEKLRKEMSKWFARIYKMLDWKVKAWDDFKRFAVEGELAWEIVYDSLEKPTQIIGLVPVDTATLTRKFENGKWYWYQFKDVQGKERKLLDIQIVFIQYQETNCITRQSYLERLVRPFNIYRIIEQAQIIWTVTNAQSKMMFTIPTNGMTNQQSVATVASAMNRYREVIRFKQDEGQIEVNGQSNMPFQREIWLASNEAGQPEVEQFGGDGPELNDNDQLKYFKNQLYKISKIPLDRFDVESGTTWFGTDGSSVARAEIAFARFVDRMRTTFAQVILHPLQYQMMLSMPELMEYKEVVNAISMHYNSYNPFEEVLGMELTQKRVEFIQTMKESLVDMDAEGNDIKFFSSEFLVKKYLHFSDADIELNKEMKKKEDEEMGLAGGEDAGQDDFASADEQLANLLEQVKKRKSELQEEIKEKKKKGKQKPKPKKGEEE